MGETFRAAWHAGGAGRLSVSSNGSTWVKPRLAARAAARQRLSVSSNGSTWVKLPAHRTLQAWAHAFSILERIDVGETNAVKSIPHTGQTPSFSILERIDVGETSPGRGWRPAPARLSVSSNGSTWVKPCTDNRGRFPNLPFSILERIDVGETARRESDHGRRRQLSVSSNGSTWVKQVRAGLAALAGYHFQYPRTDRRG